jgi:hypothetical protein
VNGERVWAVRDAAHGAGSVLELNASNGRWIRTFSGGRYGFRLICPELSGQRIYG